MPAPLGHPDSCGCQVCRRHREQLEVDPRAREIDASAEEEDRYQPDPVDDWRDPDDLPDDPVGERGEPRRVVVEHRYETVEHHEHHDEHGKARPGKADTKDLERRTARLERKTRRRHRRRGILRTLAIGCVLVWVLQSFYPELDVPLVPGVACTSPSSTVAAVDATPTLGLPFVDLGLGDKVKDLAEDTVGKVVKKVVLGTAAGALNLAGDTVRVMASHPPTVDGIRTGLVDDVTTVGKAAGFVIGGLSGKSPVELVPDLGATTVADTGCVPCPTPGTGGRGVEVAARAALAAGWTGQDAVTAVAIAGAESGYDPTAANTSSSARGLWQTMMSLHAGKYQGASWTDPDANARVAYTIWREAGGWTPWVAYTSGAYRSHLAEARAAVIAAQGSDTTPVAATTAAVKMPGLQPVAQRAADYVRATWGVDDIGGYATSGHMAGSKHYEGLAIDVMTYGDKALGQRIYDYFAGPGYGPFGVDNVIFNRRIYNAGRGDHDYGDHGNPTLNHEDHVHIDFHAGAGGQSAPAADMCVAPMSTSSGYRVATFNILGARHTPGTWRERWPGVPQLLASHGVTVAGLQEVHPEQRPLVDGMPGWGTFGDWDAVMVWRTDVWTLEDARYVTVPMYPGRTRREPLVRLRSAAGSVWFLDVHNSRDGWARGVALRRELQAVEGLDGPVVWLGDTNDRGFAGWVARRGFRSAGTPSIDQITGAGVKLRNGTRLPKTGLVARTSDHTLVYADLTVNRVL